MARRRTEAAGFFPRSRLLLRTGFYGHWAKLRKGGIDKPQSGSRPARAEAREKMYDVNPLVEELTRGVDSRRRFKVRS